MPTKFVETKHYHISQKLRENIHQSSAHQKLPTMVELQEKYQVSRTTVERALQKLRKEHLIYRPDGKQRYVVAPRHDRAVFRIAMIRPDYPSQDIDEICRMVADAGKQKRWVFDLVSYSDMESLDLEIMGGDNDAIVFVPRSEEFPDHLIKAFNNPRKPVVLLQEHCRRTKACNVCVNDFEAGRLAVDYLASLGHKKVAIVLDQPHVSSICQRQRGWRTGMEDIGHRDLDELIIDCEVRSGQNAMVQTHRKLIEYFTAHRHPDFTAIFNTSAFGAMATLKALDELGITVPDEMNVIAYVGEAAIAPFMKPELTALEIDRDEYGRAAVDFLEKLLTNVKLASRFFELPPRLVVRQTTSQYLARPIA